MAFDIVETLFRGICVGVAASITVGPVAVLCIQRTLSKNRRSGIISGIGVACADTFMAMIALFFYSMLQTQIEQYNTLLRVIGGIFVVIVGVFIFAQNPVPQIRRNRAGKTSLWQDFASIFGLTIANFIMVIPYILAFFAVFKISSGEMTTHRRRLLPRHLRHHRVLLRCRCMVDIPRLRHQPLPQTLPPPAHAHHKPCRRTHHRNFRHLHHIIHFF